MTRYLDCVKKNMPYLCNIQMIRTLVLTSSTWKIIVFIVLAVLIVIIVFIVCQAKSVARGNIVIDSKTILHSLHIFACNWHEAEEKLRWWTQMIWQILDVLSKMEILPFFLFNARYLRKRCWIVCCNFSTMDFHLRRTYLYWILNLKAP